MCNIAGYVGRLDAAPILIKMIKAQEGLNGGFYSGLAVHDSSAVCYRKTRGDFDRLLADTDAEKLVGTTGIIHSRTPSGGDSSWAHPFVTERCGEVKLAYVANGSMGKFGAEKDRFDRLANELVREGYDIPCRLNLRDEKYCMLESGEAVHMSDVMCQLIYKNTETCDSVDAAMARAFCEMPGEIVGLCLDERFPDRIFYSRINMPMFVGFDADGAYLASSPTAFPATVESFELLPAASSGVIYRDHYETAGLKELTKRVRRFNRRTIDMAVRTILAELSLGERGVPALRATVKRAFPKTELLQTHAIVYIALHELLYSGHITEIRARTTLDGRDAPLTLFSAKK